MNDELRVLEGAEKVLNRRGYAWFNYGQAPGPICLGGAMASTFTQTHYAPSQRHPACARIVKILDPPDQRLVRMSRDRDRIRDVSMATNFVPEEEVRAALSQAISECRAEQATTPETDGVKQETYA